MFATTRFLVVLSITALPAIAQIPGAERIEAIVNNEVVTRYDVDKALKEDKIDLSTLKKSDAAREYKKYLVGLVRDILSRQAAQKAGLEVSEEQFINARIRRIEGRFQTEAAFQNFLTSQGKSESEFNDELRTQLRTQAWLQVVSGISGAKSKTARPQFDITVSPKSMREFYKANREKTYHQKAAVNLQVIQIPYRRGVARDRIKQMQLVGQIKQKLKTKADFGVLAKRHSAHPSKTKGGALGWVEFGSDLLPPKIEEVVFGQDKPMGLIPSQVNIVNAFWLVNVLDRREDRVVPFKEAQKSISKRLRNEKIQRALARVQLDLVKESYIYPKRLKAELLEYFRSAALR